MARKTPVPNIQKFFFVRHSQLRIRSLGKRKPQAVSSFLFHLPVWFLRLLPAIKYLTAKKTQHKA